MYRKLYNCVLLSKFMACSKSLIAKIISLNTSRGNKKNWEKHLEFLLGYTHTDK